MESIDESIEISREKLEPSDLLDNSWFFNNLFNTKRRPPIIPRCYSDPCPSFSPNFIDHHQPEPDKSMEEAFSAIRKLPTEAGRFSRPAGLTRAPSLPEESAPQRVRKSNLQRSSNNTISRAPSLPASMVIREEIQDDESDFSMSRLIRQASLNQSDLLPPRPSQKVVVTRSPSTPKQRPRTSPDIENLQRPRTSPDIENLQRPRTKPDIENLSTKSYSEGVGVRRQQHHNSGTRLARSTSDTGFQELLGFKELSVGKKTNEEPSSSKAWQEQSTSPTTQVTEQWAADKRRSVEDDMKAQIKFWARTVASNVK